MTNKFNTLQDNHILDWSKWKALADDKLIMTSKLEICYWQDRKHCGKRRKCRLPAFSPFPTMFSKDLFFQGS